MLLWKSENQSRIQVADRYHGGSAKLLRTSSRTNLDPAFFRFCSKLRKDDQRAKFRPIIPSDLNHDIQIRLKSYFNKPSDNYVPWNTRQLLLLGGVNSPQMDKYLVRTSLYSQSLQKKRYSTQRQHRMWIRHHYRSHTQALNHLSPLCIKKRRQARLFTASGTSLVVSVYIHLLPRNKLSRLQPTAACSRVIDRSVCHKTTSPKKLMSC